MKSLRPQAPTDLPPGTVQVGGAIDWFSISLGVKGDDLVPDEVTAVLRRKPDAAQQKDRPLYRSDGTLMRIPKFGAWWAKLARQDTDEWDCAAAIGELLATVERDVAVWQSLRARHEVVVRVGLARPFSGAGFELPDDLLRYLGERGIAVGFEVYSDDQKTG